jgi:hypothetical protein
MTVDHGVSLKQSLDSAATYIGLALKSRERGERELLETVAELHLKIADCLERLAET